jgi:hypothetical protein
MNLSKDEWREIARHLLIAEAQRWVGTKEEGNNAGQIVSLFQGWDGSPDHVSWCMAFVQFCLKNVDLQVEAILGSTPYDHLLAKSESCLNVWNNTPKTQRISTPREGSIAIWQHWKDGKATIAGHTGIVVGYKTGSDAFTTVEGNTGTGVGVVREGDGVYQRTRSVKGSNEMKLLGFLLPW